MAKFTWKSKEETLQEEEELRLKQETEALLKEKLSEAPEKIINLENENMSLMLAAAETYEQMYNENMALMLAVTEMYEELQILKGGTP